MCFDRQQLVEQRMLPKLRSNDIVFIGNALYARFNKNWRDGERYSIRSGASLNINDAAKLFSRRFQELADAITSKGAKVVLYIDGVQFPKLISSGDMCKAEWFRPQWAVSSNCFHDLDDHLQVINRNFSWRNNWHNGITKITWNAYEFGDSCSEGVCNASKYNDSNHFKRDYAAFHFFAFIQNYPELFAADSK